MNHQPFRDWLLSEEKLSADQNQRMQEHLSSCDSCKETEVAWLEVESALHRSSQVSPAAGFTARWQTHLIEYQSRRQKRDGWVTIGVIAFVITALLGFSLTQIWTLLQSPGPYLAIWFDRLVSLLSVYYTLRGIVSPFRMDSPLITFTAMFFILGIISFMSVLWLATIRKLSLARRFV